MLTEMEVLKQVVFWIAVTLVGGFVAYVGRYGAERVLKRRKARQEEAMDRERAKVEKKRAKAAAKAEKKRSSQSD